MMRGFGLDAAQAGGMVAVTFLLGVVGAPLGGWLADIWHKRNKTGRAYLMAISHLLDLILIGTMFFFYTKSLTIFMVLLAIDTVMAGFMSTLVYSMTSDVVPIRFRISGFSLLMTCGFAIGALGPWTVGLISDAFGGGSNGLQMGFFMTLPALLLSTLFYSLSCISYAPDSARCSDLVYQDNK
jgi:MFS family permease